MNYINPQTKTQVISLMQFVCISNDPSGWIKPGSEDGGDGEDTP